MRIVVFGATGGTGVEVVKQALGLGWEVISFARSRQPNAGHPLLTAVSGDVLDAQAVARTVLEARPDVVVSALGVKIGEPPGKVRSIGTGNIVAAMEKAGVKKLIAISAIGVSGTRNSQTLASRILLPLIVGRERLREVEEQEAIISSSSLDWLLLRAPRLLDGESKRAVRAEATIRSGMGASITRKALASTILHFAHSNQTCRRALMALG